MGAWSEPSSLGDHASRILEASAGLRMFHERRLLDDDGALYRARLDAWDAEHEKADES